MPPYHAGAGRGGADDGNGTAAEYAEGLPEGDIFVSAQRVSQKYLNIVNWSLNIEHFNFKNFKFDNFQFLIWE